MARHQLPVPVELGPRHRARTIVSTVTRELHDALVSVLEPPRKCGTCGLPMVSTPNGRRCPIGDRR